VFELVVLFFEKFGNWLLIFIWDLVIGDFGL